MQRDKASSAGHFQWREGLTPKQARFIEEYLVDLNATQAALRAGYSPRTAGKTGYENLQRPEISAALKAAQEERSRRTEITQDRVLNELAKIGFGDIRELFDDHGNLKRPEALTEHAAARIAQIEVVTRCAGGEVEYVHKIRAWDKVAALTQIGRHLGMFTDRTEHSGQVTLEQIVAASLKKSSKS